METARSVVAKRIDPNGTSEVSVTRQGSNRIQVQVPGLQDPERLKARLGETTLTPRKGRAADAEGGEGEFPSL